MAKQRYVNTRFWDDGYIVTLDPIEKLLFLYFLTNPLTEICGGYEIPLRRIAYDTGIDKDMVLKILGRFADADKIIYRDGWLFVVNFIKHQNLESPKIKQGVENSLSRCPDWIKDRVKTQDDRLYIGYGYPMDTLSHLNTNSNTNTNSNPNENEPPTPAFDLDKFEYPVREIVEAFPQVQFQPTHFGFFEAEIGTEPEDRAAWLETVKIYRQNYDPRTNSYLPTRVATVLSVYRRERERIAREKMLAAKQRTAAHVGKSTLTDDGPVPPCIACGQVDCGIVHTQEELYAAIREAA